MSTTTVRPMRADARRNRERILAAARELFADSRTEVQIDDVAQLAGVGVGTVYRHFPDKYALMGELVRERFALFNERMRLAVAEGERRPVRGADRQRSATTRRRWRATRRPASR